jgi:tetratricopeptide (TPR) repeat protein
VSPLHVASPQTEFRRRQLWLVLTGLAQAYGDTGQFHLNQPAKSLELLRRAKKLEEAPGLAAFEAAWEGAYASAILARIAGQSASEIRSATQSAMQHLSHMDSVDPQSALGANLRVLVDRSRIQLEVREGRDGDALAIARKSYQALSSQLLKNPHDVSLLDLSQRSRVVLASVCIALKQWDEAARHLAEAAGSAEQLARKYPDDLYFIRNGAWVLETQGDLRLAQGNTAQAVDYYRQAIAAWQRWSRIGSTSQYADLYLAGLRAKISDPARVDVRVSALQRY